MQRPAYSSIIISPFQNPFQGRQETEKSLTMNRYNRKVVDDANADHL